MAILTKDGQVIPTGNTVDTTGQSLGGGFYLPETKENIYGAFGNITLDEDENKGVEPIVYNVYQQQAQTYERPDMLQYTYGTGQNPVFEWVKTIQTGQRSYNPQDNFDQSMLDEYRKMYETGQVPQGGMTPEEIMKQVALETATTVGSQAGAQIGAAIVDPSLQNQQIIQRGLTGLKSTFSDLPSQHLTDLKLTLSKTEGLENALAKGDLTIVPNMSNPDIAADTGNLKNYLALEKTDSLTNLGTAKNPIMAVKTDTANRLAGTTTDGTSGANVNPDNYINQANVSATADTGSFTGRLNWNTETGASNWASAAGAAGVSFVTSLVMGEKPLKAAKRAGGMAIGRAIGTAVAPMLGPLAPLAPIVGGTLGSILGGRVICNELCRQKIMDRKQVYLDYKFTKEYLTPTHVVGYHTWAVWMVKQMRKGKYVNFWSHVAGHRANEIAYIYGERDKPDYLGKLYRKILEPTCWFIGKFNKPTDWSILYQKKEII